MMGHSSSVIRILSQKQSPIHLIYREIDYNSEHDIVIKSFKDTIIKGVIVRTSARAITWSSDGDFTGGFATLYVDIRTLDAIGEKIIPNSHYVIQDDIVFKIKQLYEYNTYYKIGIYLLEMADDTIIELPDEEVVPYGE